MITIRADGVSVTTEGGCPTYPVAAPILAGNETVEMTAMWWEISESAVIAAVRWERELRERPALRRMLRKQGIDFGRAYLAKHHPEALKVA